MRIKHLPRQKRFNRRHYSHIVVQKPLTRCEKCTFLHRPPAQFRTLISVYTSSQVAECRHPLTRSLLLHIRPYGMPLYSCSSNFLVFTYTHNDTTHCGCINCKANTQDSFARCRQQKKSVAKLHAKANKPYLTIYIHKMLVHVEWTTLMES